MKSRRTTIEAEDRIFAAREPRAGGFVFDDEVAGAFDDMIARSVPFYAEQQRMLAEIAGTFWIPGTRIYDLGCSTGTTLIRICAALGDGARGIGYDNSRPMLERAAANVARAGLAARIELRHADLDARDESPSLDGASVVTLCWTLQFVRPLRRDHLVRWIYDALPTDGALVVTDKVLTNTSTMNRVFVDFYYDFKRRNRYSEVEIARKREALENVLIPYRTEENLEMFRRNGFEIVEVFFQWYNFAGFLCVKKPR